MRVGSGSGVGSLGGRQTRQLARAIAAARLFLSEAGAVYQQRPKLLSGRLRSAQAVDQFIRAYRPTVATEEQEVFLALALNAKHQVKQVVEVARGTLASVDVHPRELFRPLIEAV